VHSAALAQVFADPQQSVVPVTAGAGVEAGDSVTGPAKSSTESAGDHSSVIGWDEPYCGIVSAWVVLRHFDKSVEFRDLIDVKYVGSWDGSTGLQVQEALRSGGIESRAMSRTNPSTLAACRGPVILHTRSRSSPLYRHWVTWLGRDETGLRILDPALGSVTMTEADLLAQWDGLMIAPVESLPAGPWFQLATYSEYLLPASLGGILLGALTVFGSRMRFAMHSSRLVQGGFQAATLIVCGIGLGTGLAAWAPGGLKTSSSAVATIAGLYPGEFLQEATLDDVRQAAADQSRVTVLIDCRLTSSVQHGTVPSAINLPVDATAADESRILAGVDPTQPVILFCQSESCGFDEVVARRLIGRGFTDIRLFHEGYVGWKNWTKSNADPPESPETR
jgi:rhodanese-related sulfurtransferase